jgi:hypothetical protein
MRGGLSARPPPSFSVYILWNNFFLFFSRSLLCIYFLFMPLFLTVNISLHSNFVAFHISSLFYLFYPYLLLSLPSPTFQLLSLSPSLRLWYNQSSHLLHAATPLPFLLLFPMWLLFVLHDTFPLRLPSPSSSPSPPPPAPPPLPFLDRLFPVCLCCLSVDSSAICPAPPDEAVGVSGLCRSDLWWNGYCSVPCRKLWQFEISTFRLCQLEV